MQQEQKEINPISSISPDVKLEIMTKHIEPAYKKDIIDLLHGKRCWRITGQTFETISKVFVAVGSIVSFAAGVYNETNLSFIAGAISTFSLATLQFSSFSYRENKKQSSELNTLLKNINIAAIPNLERSAESEAQASMRQTISSQPQQQYISMINEISDKLYTVQTENDVLKEEILKLTKKKDEEEIKKTKSKKDEK
jgi:hypothetical protein